MKTNKVLIPIDGSELSLQVLPYVMRFLSPEQNELILLQVAEPPSVVRLGVSADPDMVIYVDQAEALLKKAFRNAMHPHIDELAKAGFQVTTAMRFGDPADEIKRFIDEEQIDLVAMTSHGRSGLAQVLLGSVAQALIRRSPATVLLCRQTVTRPTTAQD